MAETCFSWKAIGLKRESRLYSILEKKRINARKRKSRPVKLHSVVPAFHGIGFLSMDTILLFCDSELLPQNFLPFQGRRGGIDRRGLLYLLKPLVCFVSLLFRTSDLNVLRCLFPSTQFSRFPRHHGIHICFSPVSLLPTVRTGSSWMKQDTK